MQPSNGEGPRVRTAGPPANHTISDADRRASEPDSKAIATLIAQISLAGHAVHKATDGSYTVCRYGLSRYCGDIGDLQSFAKMVGVLV